MLADANQAKNNIQAYNNFKLTYLYLSKIKGRAKPDKDSLRKAVDQINENVSFRPGISRFEGFKSGGKLEEIADKQLLQNILNYYEQAIPQLNNSENGWIGLQKSLSDFFTDSKTEYDDGTNNYFQLITMPKAKNLSKKLVPWPQLYERYNQIIALSSTVVKEIDNNYSKTTD